MTHSNSRIPIILLAFANDDDRSLRQLDEEQRALIHILDPVRKEGKCEVRILAAATAEDVVEAFLKYQHRIRVFHYGGHSDTDAIFFKNTDQTQRGTKAENLKQFLALQQDLELIFLNSCLSLPQARQYQAAGAKVVLATGTRIGDEAARKFAWLFYTALVGGADIRKAFEQAEAGLKVNPGDDPARGIGLDKEEHKPSWQLFPEKPISPWKLPLVARQLTRIPAIDLEEEFLGREKDMKRLKDKLDKASKVVLMNGLGGIGKTVLATAYVQQYGSNYDHLAWISRGEDLIESIALNQDLAEHLGLPFEQEEEFEARFGRILRKLHQLPGQNLLVIDNAQEQVAQKKIYELLPGLPNWRVLLTSRLNLSGFDRLPLDTLEPDATRKLFRTYYKGTCAPEELEALLQEIGYHTLTVELLAKLLDKLNHVLSISDLTEILRQKQLDEPDLQEKVWARHSGKERGIFLHLMKAFELSNLDEKENWLLKHLVVLPVERYPVKKLAILLQEEPLKLNKTLNSLVTKGWLTPYEDKTFSIHRLIRQAAEYQLNPSFEDMEALMETIIEKMHLEDTRRSRIKVTADWINYATAIESYFSEYEHKRVAVLQNNIALTFHDLAQYKVALKYHKKCLAIRNLVLDEQHLEVSSSYHNIAITYRKLGQYKAALKYHKKSLAIREGVLDSQHPDLANSYNSIANSFNALGKTKQAISYFKKALAIRESILPSKHQDLAASYNNIANSYSALGDYKEALHYDKKAMVILESILDKQHPYLWISYNNIAGTFRSLGQYKDALLYLNKSLAIKKSILDTQHPDIATSYNNIALTYSKMGNHVEALSYHQEALQIRKSVLDAQDPDLAASFNNIGVSYRDLEHYEEALNYLQKAIIIRESILGIDHPDLAISYHNIGFTYYNIRQYDEALSYLQKALNIQEEVLKTNHPDLLNSYNNIAETYRALGQIDQAEEYEAKAATIRSSRK